MLDIENERVSWDWVTSRVLGWTAANALKHYKWCAPFPPDWWFDIQDRLSEWKKRHVEEVWVLCLAARRAHTEEQFFLLFFDDPEAVCNLLLSKGPPAP